MDFGKLRELQEAIALAGSHGPAAARLKWEFGKCVLRLQADNNLGQHVACTTVSKAIGISQTECDVRARFATLATTEEELGLLLTKYPTWRALRFDFIHKRRPASPATVKPPALRKLGKRTANNIVLKAVVTLADSSVQSPQQIAEAYGSSSESSIEMFLRMAAMLPWCSIIKLENGYRFDVDWDLKAFCDNHTPGAVGKFSLVDHLRNIRAKITQLREEEHIERTRRTWNTVLSPQLIKILDFVEVELDKIPTTTTRKARPKPMPSLTVASATEKENTNDYEEGCESITVNPNAGQ